MSEQQSKSAQKLKNQDCQKLLNTSTNYYAEEIKRLNKESEADKLLAKWSHLLYQDSNSKKDSKTTPSSSSLSSFKQKSHTVRPSTIQSYIQQQQQQLQQQQQPKSKSKQDIARKYDTLTASMQKSLNNNLKSASSTSSLTRNSKPQIDKVLNLVLDSSYSSSKNSSSQPKQSTSLSLKTQQPSNSSQATITPTITPVRTMIKPQSLDSKLASLINNNNNSKYNSNRITEEKLMPKLTEKTSSSKLSLTNGNLMNINNNEARNISKNTLRSNPASSNNLNDLAAALSKLSNNKVEVPRIRNFQTPVKHSTSIDTTAFTNTKVTFTLNPDSIINLDSTIDETLTKKNESTKSTLKKSSFPVSSRSNTLIKTIQSSPNLTRETSKLSETEKSLLNAIATEPNSIAASNEDNTISLSTTSSSGSSSSKAKNTTYIKNDETLNKTITLKMNKLSLSNKRSDEEIENDEPVIDQQDEETNNFEVEIEADEEESYKKDIKEKDEEELDVVKKTSHRKSSLTNGKKHHKKKVRDQSPQKQSTPSPPPSPKPRIFNINGDEDWNSEVLMSTKPIIVEFHSA